MNQPIERNRTMDWPGTAKVSVSMCACVTQCAFQNVCMRACVCVYKHVRACACASVCVCVCTCMHERACV